MRAAVWIGIAIALFLLAIVDHGAFARDRCPGQVVGASWYGPGFHGRHTASGERFNQNAMTAAHKSLPFGTRARVSYRGKSVVVRINDRGPFVKGRALDLSKAAAQRIGLIQPGHAPVCMVIL
jgi:rare lipoprotein A